MLKNSRGGVEDEVSGAVPTDHRDTIAVCAGLYDGSVKFTQQTEVDWVPPEMFKCEGRQSRRVGMNCIKPQPEHTEEELALTQVVKTGQSKMVDAYGKSYAQRLSWGSFRHEKPSKK
jgi:hypothetical protein